MGVGELPWAAVLEIAKSSGMLGVAFILGFWNVRWMDRRDERKEQIFQAMVHDFRKDVQAFMDQYRAHMQEFRDKYDSNVVLVEQTQEIARRVIRMSEELTGVVSLNTQVQTRLAEKIEHNMFCPVASGRLERPK